MERRFIRSRWQVTIPRSIRQELNLHLGQVLNFNLTEGPGGDWEIRVFPGNYPAKIGEQAAFQDYSARAKRKLARQKKKTSGNFFRKSDMKLLHQALKIIEDFGGKGHEAEEETEI